VLDEIALNPNCPSNFDEIIRHLHDIEIVESQDAERIAVVEKGVNGDFGSAIVCSERPLASV